MTLPATPNPDVVLTSTTGTPEDVTNALASRVAPTQVATPATIVVPATAVADPAVVKPAVDDKAASEAGKVLAERRRDVDRSEKVEQRIAKLGYDKHVLQDRLSQTEAENARLRDQIARSTAAPATVPDTAAAVATTRAKPTADQVGTGMRYPTYEDFVEDLADWKSEQREARIVAKVDSRVDGKISARDQEAAQAANVAAAQAADVQFKERAAEFLKTTPDYNEVVAAAEDFVAPPPMHAVIVSSELGPDLVYHLITHPDEHQKLLKLAPGPLIKAMGRLEEKIERAKEAAAKATPVVTPAAVVAPSTAASAFAAPVTLPAPPSPVGAGQNNNEIVFTDTGDNYSEFRAKRNAEVRQQGRRY